MFGWDRTQPGNQSSTQGQIRYLSLYDMAVPVQGTGNGNLIAFKFAPLFLHKRHNYSGLADGIKQKT